MKSFLDGLIDGSSLLQSVPRGLVYTVGILLACKAVLLLVSLFAGEIVWMERRISGRMQARIGPNRVGPQGLLQFLADGVKLMAKEDVIPTSADRLVFLIAPYIVFAGVFAAFAAIPFGAGLVPANLTFGLFYVLAITSVEVVGVIMAGWSSNSKWSILGTMREVAQVISYEMPLAISALTVAVLAGTLNLSEIVDQQQGWVWQWWVLRSPATFVGFFLFFTAALAALKRAPFDLPEAESELIAGFYTEYSAMKMGLFMFAEFIEIAIIAALFTVLFLGGCNLPYMADDGFHLPGGSFIAMSHGAVVVTQLLTFLVKVMAMCSFQILVRWTLPRFRYDQVLKFAWKFLLPLALANLTVTVLLRWAWQGAMA